MCRDKFSSTWGLYIKLRLLCCAETPKTVITKPENTSTICSHQWTSAVIIFNFSLHNFSLVSLIPKYPSTYTSSNQGRLLRRRAFGQPCVHFSGSRLHSQHSDNWSQVYLLSAKWPTWNIMSIYFLFFQVLTVSIDSSGIWSPTIHSGSS